MPKEPASYSGVGSRSRRTDGGPIRGVPNVQDSTDLKQGDRAKLEAGQRIAPIQRSPQPQIQAQQTGPPPMSGGGLLPEHLFSSPSSRPGEPETAGLPFGPGPGPEVLAPQPEDEREVVLSWLASQPNAPQAIVDMQNEIRNSRMAPQQPPMPVMSAEEPTAEELPDEPVDEEIALEEQEEAPIEAVEEDDFAEEEEVVV